MRLGYFASTARGRLRQEFFHCMRERFGPLDIAYVTGAGDLDELRAVQLLVHFPHRGVRWILFANQEQDLPRDVCDRRAKVMVGKRSATADKSIEWRREHHPAHFDNAW